MDFLFKAAGWWIVADIIFGIIGFAIALAILIKWRKEWF